MERYGPDDKWRKHPKPWFRDVFDLARGYGWSLEYKSDHGAYLLICPAGDCIEPVFSTGRGGESAAKSARRRVERCPDGRIAEPITRARTLLDKAERLLNAVEVLSDRAEHYKQVEHLVELEDSCADDAATELLDEIDRLSAEVTELLGVGSTEDTSELLADSKIHLDAVAGSLNPLPRMNPLVRAQRLRLSELRARRYELAKATHHPHDSARPDDRIGVG